MKPSWPSWREPRSAASHTSGTLSVSGGGVSATVTLIGSYTQSNFSGTVSNGHFAVTDPGIVNGGNAEAGAVAAAALPNGIDLPNIAFGAQTTLAYTENKTGAGGTLTLTDGRHAAAVALLGNYMAASFVTTADGHGGTLVTAAEQTGQPLLARPPHA